MFSLIVTICVWMGNEVDPNCTSVKLQYATLFECGVVLTNGVHVNINTAAELGAIITGITAVCKKESEA